MNKKIILRIGAYLFISLVLTLGILTITTHKSFASEPTSAEIIPDGVYSFWNLGSGFYMDVRFNSPKNGAIIQQYDYGYIPSTEADRAGLFRVEKIAGTQSQYVLRSMLNTNNLVSYNATTGEVKTTEPASQSIPNSCRWNITLSETYGEYGVYLISHAFTPNKYLCAPDMTSSGGYSNSQLVLKNSVVDETNLWILDLYTGATIKGVEICSTNSQMLDKGQSKSIASDITYQYFYSSTVGENAPGTITNYEVLDPSGGVTYIATVSTAGLLTAKKAGTVAVKITYSSGAKGIIYYYIRPENEEYFYFQNDQLSNGIEYGLLSKVGTQPLKSTQSFGSNQLWKLVDCGNGYYEIHNQHHPSQSYILTSPASDTNYASVMIQTTRLTGSAYSRQRWKITETPSGRIRIQSEYQEINCPTMYLNINPTTNKLIQSVWTNNSNYLDEFRFIYIGNDITFLRTVPSEFGAYDLTQLISITNRYYESYTFMDKHISVLLNQVTNPTNGLAYTPGILIINGHGSPTVITVQDKTATFLRNTDIYSVDTNGNVSSLPLACDLVIFAGCSTGGSAPSSQYNLVRSAAMAGAEFVVGFEETIYGNEVNRWIDDFLYSLSLGLTGPDAVDMANTIAETYEGHDNSMSSGVFFGASNFVLD